jgi:hypothetical protein
MEIHDFRSFDVDPAVPAAAERLLQGNVIHDDVCTRLREGVFLIQQLTLRGENIEEILRS